MSDTLQIGASGVRAFNTAMAAISENVSNASTPGYARRIVSFKEAPSTTTGTTGNMNGVLVTSVTRAWDDYRAAAARGSASDAAASAAYYAWAQKTEDALADDSAGVGQSATTIFTAADALAANPGDTSSRKAFLASIDTTARAFNTSAAALRQAGNDVATAATAAVEKVNATLDSLDNVNAALHQVAEGTAGQANLLDQRDKLLDDLSTQIGIDVTVGLKGTVTVRTNSGTVLASPTQDGARLSIGSGPATDAGRITITAINTRDETPLAEIGGTIGGLVDASNMIAQQRVALDDLAQGFAQQLNDWSAQGTDATGATGGKLLSGGTAATLALATSDPTKVPAASKDASGNTVTNGNLLTLSTLRDGSGVEKQWATLITDQGRTVDRAKTANDAATSRSETAAAALAEVTSVDLDTEAASLIKYQQAYAGAAKVIQAARDTMQALLNVI